FLCEAVKFLAHLGQPTTASQAPFPHDAAQDLIGVRVLVGITLQAKRLRKFLPRGDNQCLRTEWRLPTIIQLLSTQQNLLRHREIGYGVHATPPMYMKPKI